MLRTTNPNMTMESESTRATAHRLGGADDFVTDGVHERIAQRR